MYAAEVISQLRTLNWLKGERAHLPPGSAQAALLAEQEQAVRQRLPQAILAHHDALAAVGRASVAELNQSCCGACHGKVPPGTAAELRDPGRFGVCPHCGVFLWVERVGGKAP